MRFIEGLIVLILGAGIAYSAMIYQPLREQLYSWQDVQVEQAEDAPQTT